MNLHSKRKLLHGLKCRKRPQKLLQQHQHLCHTLKPSRHKPQRELQHNRTKRNRKMKRMRTIKLCTQGTPTCDAWQGNVDQRNA